MSQSNNDPKPLFLSAEEAMGLLDLCIMSQTDFDRDREGILLKLSDLVREHLVALEEENGEVGKASENGAHTESQEMGSDALPYVESGRLPLSAIEIASAPLNMVRQAMAKPCPAVQFRSWITTPSH